MDVLAWLWWLLSSLIGGLLGLVWFLVSGWVSTLLQIAVLMIVICVLKYGWQRTPVELWRKGRTFASFFVSWIRGRDGAPAEARASDTVRIVRVKEFGDINVSTLLSVLALAGLVLAARL